ncbi:MAG TPA: acetyltransferase [Betaproteobacteria bacterium]|nr:acetyltransferase [Betaproteobacteria bacterium]
MADYDVFNGDADGLCALHQLRLAEPRESTLVTGVKRDIGLLARVAAAAGDRVTVLDISLDKNRGALAHLLAAGADVAYFDHHFAGDIPVHPGLTATIDTRASLCTSLLADRALGGRFRGWAVAAAFGDNLSAAATAAAAPLALTAAQTDALRMLGESLNYNAYGESVDDLHFHPADLYRRMHDYKDPFAFIAEDAAFIQLRQGYLADMAHARACRPAAEDGGGALYILPDAAWSRRVSGAFANALANAHPQQAHAVLIPRNGGYQVSVRAPVAVPAGADTLCRQFENGGGRKSAAGINGLPESQLDAFSRKFFQAF